VIDIEPGRFEEMVATALDGLPEDLGAQMRNVAVTRLGQRERADLLQPGHWSQPALLLLLRPALRDRLHRQPGLLVRTAGWTARRCAMRVIQPASMNHVSRSAPR
jgi:predicted Zn-dependent protease with MMP-like domain